MQMKVLVVDNNPVLLKAVSAILSQEGCTVQTAGTGLEALEIVDDFCPDIVFTDLIMPMVSGEQLCRILRNTKKHQGVFIVVLSATIIEDCDRVLREVHCDVCIAKGNLQAIRQHVLGALQTYREQHATIPGSNRKAARIPDGLKPSGMTSELLSEKRHFIDILANLEEGIIELNPQGKVIAANSSALDILSCREEKLIGMTLADALDWGKFDIAIRQWSEKQLIALGMEKYDIFEDNPFLFNDRVLTASFVPISAVGSVFGLCILRDISRQYKAEKHNKELDNAIRLVKKMDAMSCMAGGFAHDFNNLLTVICGNLDILAMHGEKQNNTERQKLLHQARKAALAAVDLTRQISCFSNFGIMSRENVLVEPLVRNTIGRFFNWESDRYRITAAGKDQLVYGDPEELSQAMINILQNAVEACSGQGIEIVVTEDDFSVPQLMSGQYVPAGRYIRVDVTDAGKGIDREQLFKIFDPYYSTKERGTSKGMGLGLTVVYAILHNHGGYVVVRSKLNKGTTVSLYIPVLQDEISSPRDKGIEKVKQCVLLIEPDRQMGEIGEIMLSYLGFSVKVVADRSGAINGLKHCLADPLSRAPLVILALSAANGESAVETCRLLHEIDPKLKIIATSGSILDPVMENCRDYGFIGTLPKPFSIDSLKHITNTVLLF